MRTWLVLLLAACNSGGGDDYAISPGGGTTSTGGIIPLIDASTGDGDALTTQARVCIISDLRTPTSGCKDMGGMGLTVTVGTLTTMTTTNNGQFEIGHPSGDFLTWHVKGLNVITTVMPYTGQTVIPVFTQADYMDLIQTNHLTIIEPLHGSFVVTVVRNGTAVPMATGIVNPAPPETFYDSGTSATIWNVTATGNSGVIWAPDVNIGAATGSATITTTVAPVQQPILTIPIEDQAITFVTQSIP